MRKEFQMTSAKRDACLVVSGDAEVRRAALRALSLGMLYEGTALELGSAADLYAALDGGLAPRCILLDLALPDADAFEVLATLRRGSRLIPCAVIVLGAKADLMTATSVVRAGAQDYLVSSPLQEQTLTFAIANAVERHSLLRDFHEREAGTGASARAYRGIVEAAPTLMWQADQLGHLQHVSARWVAYTGRSRAAADSELWYAACHDEDLARVMAAWDQAQEDPSAFDIECRLQGAAGDHRWFRVRAEPLTTYSTRRPCWVATCDDIDADKRALQKLAWQRESERLLGDLAGVLLDPCVLPSELLARVQVHLGAEIFLFCCRAQDDAPVVSGSSPPTCIQRELHGEAEATEELLRRELKALGARAHSHHTLGADEDELGTLCFASRTKLAFEADERAFMEAFSRSLATARARQRREHADAERVRFLEELLRASPGRVHVLDPTGSVSRADHGRDLPSQQGLESTGSGQLEASLHHRELQALADHTPDVIARFDRALRHVFVNAAAKRATGLEADFLVGKSHRELGMPAHLCEFWENALYGVFDSGAPTTLQFSASVTGEARHYHSRLIPERNQAGEVETVLSIAEDVTERLQAESALRESEARLRHAFETAQIGWWDYDIVLDRVVWSESIERMMGFGPADFGASLQGLLGCIHADDRARVKATVEEALSGTGKYSCEMRFVRRDGSVRWCLANGQVIYDDAGTPVRIAGTDLDITVRVQTEDALRDADRRKNDFLAMLAHELRNPLAPLRTGLQLLAHRNTDAEAQHGARVMMERQVDHMVRLVDDLLDVSRITSGKVQLERSHLDLRSVLERAIEASRSSMSSLGHAFSFEQPRDPVFVEGDATRLVQVVSNLLNNAAKYTPAGGSIALTLRREGACAVVRVTDDGVGIDVAQQQAVFALFAQMDRSYGLSQGGLGVGLALVRSLVELHGGEVELESAGEGRGCTFTVRLELAADQVARPSRLATATPEPAATLHQRILIIDDNEDAAELLALMLKALGHEPLTASHGLEGVELARREVPDIVLCDIGLPDIDGYEVCRRIRKLPGLERTLLVALTGWGGEGDQKRGRDAGFVRHFVKPVDVAQLSELLSAPRS
jgi:PAS domain S-box-containing protein